MPLRGVAKIISRPGVDRGFSIMKSQNVESPISSVSWPRISIVTPSYNQGKYIERTVRSVLLQRYPNLEYILMDGGSTDDTLDRIAPYRDQFSYFVSEPDGGQADAIAKGFARSSGEIMAYLNSDDLLAPDALHFAANFFRENPNIDWIYSHRCYIDDDDRVLRYWILPPHWDFLMRRWDYIPQETCFWRRSLFEKTGNIDRSYRFAMDYDLFVRLMNKGRGRRLNRFLGAFREHGTSKTKQLLETVGTLEMLRVRRKFRISAAVTDGFFGLLLGNWVLYAGRYFAAAAHFLPGGFGGIGYDYNEVWGGLLRPGDSSSADRDGFRQHDDGFYSPLCPVTHGVADRVLHTVQSGQGDEIKWKAIHLNSKSQVAIIGPAAEQEETGLKSDLSWGCPANDQVAFNSKRTRVRRLLRGLERSVLEIVCRWPLDLWRTNVRRNNRRNDDILWFTQGLVSKDDEIAFLNVGSLGGELLSALAGQTKWKLSGLEPESAAAAEALPQRWQIFRKDLSQVREVPGLLQGFDLIFLENQLQHFEEPRASLRTLAILLKLRGLLILRTPNLDSAQRKWFGPAWTHWKPEKHRYIYSRKSLIKLLEQTGFSLVKLHAVSDLESTDPGVEHLNIYPASDARCADNAKMPAPMHVEEIARVRHLLWDKLGKGDEILAIFRRVS